MSKRGPPRDRPPNNPPLERAAAVDFSCGRASRVRRRGRSTAPRYAAPAPEKIMPQLRRRLIGLCLTPILLAAVDGSVTLYGQPRAYWEGDHSRVLEGTPGFRMLL